MRAIGASGEWVFPAETRSGHIEPGKPQASAYTGVQGRKDRAISALHASTLVFDLGGLTHGPVDVSAPRRRQPDITKRYIHPQEHSDSEAMKRAKCRERVGAQLSKPASAPTWQSRVKLTDEMPQNTEHDPE